ncbi:tRNA (adenosine(37)-N6)-threonylcarbamoyltransferase complex dimerization subunit type 1 TsaB [soil metagenome]
MSLILAIETTGATCGVAIATESGLLGEYSLFTPHMHDAMLASNVQQLLASVGKSIGDVDVCALSSGPGSFTGLRIGMAFAKGLCFDGRINLVAVPTLESCASAAQEVAKAAGSTEILAVVASHRDLYYTQAFDKELQPMHDVALITSDVVALRITSTTMLTGPGATAFSPSAISGLTRLSPRFVMRAALVRINAGRFDDVHTAIPQYDQEFIPRGY